MGHPVRLGDALPGTDAELISAQYDGRSRTALTLSRDAAVTSRASVKSLTASLAKEDAQHQPLFYVAELMFVRQSARFIQAGGITS